VNSSRGPVASTMACSSTSACRMFNGTTTIPPAGRAIITSANCAEFSAKTATRSPARIPKRPMAPTRCRARTASSP
jgi:hypothetical protein